VREGKKYLTGKLLRNMPLAKPRR